jgi:putative transposase
MNEWYFSVQTEREVEKPLHPSSSEVGIDMRVKRFSTLSNGKYVEPLNSFKRHQKRLAKAQRLMSRKKKFSKNWQKIKSKVQAIHRTIANARRDYLQKISTIISKNHAVIFLEELKVANMSASAKDTLENPGKNVRRKSGLNRSILDQG